MKKIFALVVIALFAAYVMPVSNAQLCGDRRDVRITLDEVHHPASLKQFRKANKMNQLENLIEMVREAEEAYEDIDNIDDMYILREQVLGIKRYLESAKQSNSSVERDYNLLISKITRTIRAYEGGVMTYSDQSSRYEDRGQDDNND